jgi:hypothetical protein
MVRALQPGIDGSRMAGSRIRSKKKGKKIDE